MAKSYGALRLGLDRMTPLQASIKINVILADIAQDGYSTARPFIIGNVEPEIKKFARENGINLSGDEIVMSVKQITHTLRKSKAESGKSVSPEHLADFPTRKSRMELFYDKSFGNFVYFDQERNEKFIIHPNYEVSIGKSKAKIVNYITSSKTDPTEFNMGKYMKIRRKRNG